MTNAERDLIAAVLEASDRGSALPDSVYQAAEVLWKERCSGLIKEVFRDPRGKLEDWAGDLPENVEDDEALNALVADLTRRLCKLLGCHVVRDHCGKPEHDLCSYCREVRPGQAEPCT